MAGSDEIDLRKQRRVDAEITMEIGDLATKAKQDDQIALETQIRDYLDTVEAKLASIITNTTGLNLEATQIQVRDYLDTVETKLATIITNTTGLNLEATQLLVKGVLDNIKLKTDNLDVALSTRSSEATLIQVRDYLDTVETKLASIISALPASLGQKPSSTSFPTVLSIEQEQGIFSQNTFGSSYGGLPFVAASTSSVTLVGANANRKEVYIRNTSNQNLHIRLAAGPASIPTPIMLKKDEILIEDRYLGEIRGIWESPATSGGATIMEVSL